MSKKIKFSFIKFLYACFSFLADKTGGWKIFVHPKLILGTALILSTNAAAQKPVENQKNDTTHYSVADVYKIADNDTIYTYTDTRAQFVGGDRALMKWLNEKINPPTSYIEMCYVGIQGKVFIKFVVEKDGSITNIEVIRGMHSAFDNEVVRLIEKMPKWQPAQYNGKPVRSYFTLPVTFILKH